MIPYGPGPQQRAELTVPDGRGDGPFPVIVMLHGGFWLPEHDHAPLRPLCAAVAAAGWATWNVEYRRIGSRTRPSAADTLADVRAAIEHLALLDAPLDLRRVVTAGHSAGGQLALWAAAPSRCARIAPVGAIGLAALTDLARAAELGLGDGAVVRFLGAAPDAAPDRYRHAAPRARLPLGVPQLIVHGDRDRVVPLAMSTDYAAAATRAGDAVELVVCDDLGHFGHLDPDAAPARAIRDWLAALPAAGQIADAPPG